MKSTTKLTRLQLDWSRKTNKQTKKTDSPVMNEKQNITTNPIEIERTISKYYKHLYGIILHNLDEMDKFIQTQIV